MKWARSSVHEAMGIACFKNIQPLPMHDGKTSSADGADRTGSTGLGTGTIAAGDLRIINLRNVLLVDISHE